ncbi:MAG: tyrosine-type recombinase/integrase [Prochloraceae cyanobacterium]
MKLSSPNTKSGNVERDHLTPSEIKSLITAAKKSSRNPGRNSTLILIMYRHGLRRSEAANLRWSDIDLQGGTIYIRRQKGSRSGRHPLQGDEIRALRRLKDSDFPFVFRSERGTPLSSRSVAHIILQAGRAASFEFEVRSHLLRHSCGYYLANKGYDTRLIQDYLGHTNIQNTVRYTRLSANRFEGLWD